MFPIIWNDADYFRDLILQLLYNLLFLYCKVSSCVCNCMSLISHKHLDLKFNNIEGSLVSFQGRFQAIWHKDSLCFFKVKLFYTLLCPYMFTRKKSRIQKNILLLNKSKQRLKQFLKSNNTLYKNFFLVGKN